MVGVTHTGKTFLNTGQALIDVKKGRIDSTSRKRTHTIQFLLEHEVPGQ